MRKQKGQDLIEYALMLALVVGIGGFIYTQGYGANISGVFNNAGNLLEQVDKSQEEAKEEAARNADWSYADRMAELLKNAVRDGKLTMDTGTTVYLFAQNTPYNNTKRSSSMNGYYVNGAKTNGGASVGGKDYSEVGFDGLWSAIGRDANGNEVYKDAAVHQSDVDWYGVGITNNGDDHYTLSFVQGKGYKDNSMTGFDVNAGQKYKESESWTKRDKD